MKAKNFCWHCNKKLLAKHKTEFVDPAGNKHLVHKWCIGYMAHYSQKTAFNMQGWKLATKCREAR